MASIDMPNGQSGVQSGSVFIPTPDIHVDPNVPNIGFQFDGDASFLESGFNDQILLLDGMHTQSSYIGL